MRHGIKAIRRITNQSGKSSYKERRLCVNCGAKLSKNARFCKICGTEVGIQTFQVPANYNHKKRVSFFCQLDNEKHPATDSAFQCEQCARYVCDSCYRSIRAAGFLVCSYCKGNLMKVQ
ncbi:MAG: zinc-ribbon domain-containing protein [Candidatus Hodarchaeales archaeon]|jgi:predicted amidophosphoribosyltransferase